MPRWPGCPKAAMGRTVGSQITLAHLFGTSVTCLFEGDTQHALGQKRPKNQNLFRCGMKRGFSIERKRLLLLIDKTAHL